VATPIVSIQSRLRSQLWDRRSRLERSISRLDQPADLVRLLQQVDAALSRVDTAQLGECVVCHEHVEESDLLAHPLASYCLCKLTPERLKALEHDLELAWRVQAALLPIPDLAAAGWRTHYRYLPHGPVSGDYCDLIAGGVNGEAGLHFMLGDVSGKGVAASLLMAHLNASFRALVHSGVPPQELLGRANRLLADSTLASHYATLVCGRATSSGEMQIVNAGHCPPVVVRAGGQVEVLQAAGLPLGLGVPDHPGNGHAVSRLVLDEGDSLVLYTDGITEAAGADEEEYGVDRLAGLLAHCNPGGPQDLVRKCLADLAAFLNGSERADDITILVLQRAAGA
jgi:sigma-B regulation protein RsbU (phosphoserine phosphatase)